jgi:hypothetical protein
MGFMIVNITIWIMIPFIKIVMVLKDVPNHIFLGFLQDTIALENMIAGFGHLFELLARV